MTKNERRSKRRRERRAREGISPFENHFLHGELVSAIMADRRRGVAIKLVMHGSSLAELSIPESRLRPSARSIQLTDPAAETDGRGVEVSACE